MSIATTTRTPQRQYLDDGFYIHPDPVLPPDVTDRAAQGLTDVRNHVYVEGVPPYATNWEPGDDEKALGKIEMPQIASPALRDAISWPRLGELAAEVTGAEWVQVWWVQGLYKPNTTGATNSTNIGWHQDLSYWSKSWQPGSELFTAWLALSDVRLECGPMEFVPGSHRWGKLDADFYGRDLEANRAGVAVPEWAEWSQLPVVLPAGGVSFHHCELLHGSNQNVSSSPRMSLAIHMRTDKSEPILGATTLTDLIDDPAACPVIFRRA